ncbi:MAG: metallophosphoesterase [Lentisphaeria bacterium]|nr:metallophosphoesterase [Lentisphaeria bacterium]
MLLKGNLISLVSFLFVLLAVFMDGCCKNENDYTLVFLGDIHYDREEFHDKEVMQFKEHVPYMKGVMNKDGNFSLRNHTFWTTESRNISHKNIALNSAMWEKDVPQILDNAAVDADKNNSLYAIQLGDMIHGDCGRLDLHEKNLQGALDEMDKRFNMPVLTVCGNHDSRGPHGQQAWDNIVLPYLKKHVGNFSPEGTNYYLRIGKDLYYFHDLMKPDLDYMEKVFKENSDVRYTFFISHVLLMPMDRGSFNDILSDDFHRLFALLEVRDAIVLCGHTHRISLTDYRNPVNNHRITQFVLNSTVRSPEKQSSFVPGTDAKRKIMQPEKFYHDLWKNYYAGRLETTLHTNGAGFALLRVSDDGVFIDYRNINQEKYHTFKLR